MTETTWNPCVVIPNHLPRIEFLLDWKELKGVPKIIVQDSDDFPDADVDTDVYNWAYVDDLLPDDAWIFPKMTSARRCFGFWKAWQQGYDPILTLDTDCYPENIPGMGWLERHLDNLGSHRTLGWVPSTGGVWTRGAPYSVRDKADVWLSHGVWSNVPDFDAVTQFFAPNWRMQPVSHTDVVPVHNFFPMCGMNLAFRRELAPAMYFGLMGPEWGIDRFDDIFAGIIAKRILDHLGKAAVTGAPSVEHRKQSDVFVNLRKEAPGMELNEHFWKAVRDVPLNEGHDSVLLAFEGIVSGLPDVIQGEPPGWTREFKRAALVWSWLFT